MKVFKDAEPDEDGKLSLQSVKNIIEEHKDFQPDESVNLTGIILEYGAADDKYFDFEEFLDFVKSKGGEKILINV